MYKRILILLLYLVFFNGVTATISYPALGNISLERGTIEMWVIPLFDPQSVAEQVRERSSFWGTSFFRVQQNENDFLQLMWRVNRNGSSGPYGRNRTGGVDFLALWHVTEDWKQGEARHVAYCWEPGRNWWIIDGKQEVEKKQALRHTMMIRESFELLLGDPRQRRQIVIDDLRISSVPRQPQEVGYHSPGQLKVDAWTLLLDTFDRKFEPDGVIQTQPEVMMPRSGQTGGLPAPGTRFVEGVSGYGMEL